MKYKIRIANFKNKFLSKKPVVRNTQLMHPDREWTIGLFLAALIFLSCSFWSIHIYQKNRAAAMPKVEDSAGLSVYRESVVKEALDIIDLRKKNFDQLVDEVTPSTAVVEESATTTPVVGDAVEQTQITPQDTVVPTLGN